MALRVEPIAAEDSRAIRQAVLRPGQPREALAFEGDDAPGTLHVGAFEGERMLGVARVSREPPPGSADTGAWRIRGMAVVEDARGRGIGTALLARCLEHADAEGATVVWCNARRRAVPFYERSGFRAEGEEFEIEGIGPHRLMVREPGMRAGGG